MGCSGCTACCTMFPIEAIGKPVDTHCQYCDSGCTIYGHKPRTCSEYECAYLQATGVPETLRPDRCGVIFTKRTERIFSGVLVTGVAVTDAAKQQARDFLRQGYSVVLLSVRKPKPYVMLADGHDAEAVVREYEESLGGHVQH